MKWKSRFFVAVIASALAVPAVVSANTRLDRNEAGPAGAADYWIVRNDAGGAGMSWWISSGATSERQVFGLVGDTFFTSDFDGDGRDDLAVWRPGPGPSTFYVQRSSDGVVVIKPFGLPGDVANIGGDWNGDGFDDLAVYRPGSPGRFFWTSLANSAGNSFTWGATGDVPYSLDYDGDGRADAAVFRPSTGQHWIRLSVNGASVLQAFGASGDRVVPGDYDGDGKDDIAVARAVASTWRWWIRSSTGSALASNLPFGNSTDVLVPAAYGGGNITNVAVWRPSEGRFYVRTNLGGGGLSVFNWGVAGDTVVNSWNVH